MKKLTLSIFIFVVCFSTYSQDNENDYRISFNNRVASPSDIYVNSLMIPIKKQENISSFVGIPPQFSLYSIFSVVVNKERELFDNYLAGNISQKEFEIYLKNIDGDSTRVDNHPKYYKNKFHIYTALDKKKQTKHIIVDCNNNLDFSDDKMYSFDTKDYETKSWSSIEDSLSLYLQVNITSSDELEDNTPIKINFKILPFNAYEGKNSYSSEDEYFLNILVTTNHYKQASLCIEDKNISINEFSNKFSLIPEDKISNKSTFLLFTPKDSIYPRISKIGDTVLVADRKLFLQNKKGDLYIKDLGISLDSSRVGSFSPTLYANSIDNNRIINISSLTKDKYVFIDFWGTWCRPCIASIPQLEVLYQQIKNRNDVLLIGIALENKSDIVKLKKIMHDNNMEWLNFWEKQAELKHVNSIFSKLKIDIFPTYIILDKSGKIVFKEKGEPNTREAVDYFLNLID